jgi:hypothetical protein
MILLGLRVVNQEKASLVKELGKYLIFNISEVARYPHSRVNLATCSTVDFLISPENLVNLVILYPLGKSIACTSLGKEKQKVFYQ